MAKPVTPNFGGEQDAAEDDADVVHDGCERRDDELIFGVLNGAEGLDPCPGRSRIARGASNA